MPDVARHEPAAPNPKPFPDAQGPGLPPPLRASGLPPVHELHADDFEKLCTDLFSREPGIATCNPYGTRGQRQEGIDLIVTVRNSADVQVVQCKCYREFPKRKIKEASDAFFEHLAAWQARRVVRFVLIVAEPLAGTGQQQQIQIERRRFRDVGIRYEAWSVHTLLNRLRPWPDIVERHIDQRRGGYWIDHICGPAPYRLRPSWPSSFGPAAQPLSIEPAFAAMIELASEGVARKLEACRALARKGLHSDAEAMLDRFLDESTRLGPLPPAVVAQALQLRASLALERRDGIAEAKQYLADALGVYNAPSTILEARLALEEQGPEACLAFLNDDGTLDEAHQVLRAACHIRAGRPSDAIALLEATVPGAATADPQRLLGLALASVGQASDACQHAWAALAREPEGWATRVSLGIVLYLSALSPIARQHRVADSPEPCEWAMVRRDDVSVANLREGAAIFAALLEGRQERIDRETLQAWRLACLLNDSERQQEATEFCRAILRESPTNPFALEWALARALPVEGPGRVFEPSKAVAALRALLDTRGGDLRHLSILLTLLAWSGRVEKIGQTLRRYRARFAASDDAEWFAVLEAEASVRRGGALQDVPSLDTDRAALLAALAAPDPGEGARLLTSLAIRLRASRTNDPALVEALIRLGYLGELSAVAPHAELLVSLAQTADAVRIAAYAQHAAGEHGSTLATLDAGAASFAGRRLPRDLRILKADCLHRLGRLDAAIAEMRDVRAADPDTDTALHLADLYIRRGDIPLASDTVASISELDRVPPSDALRLAHLLAGEAPIEARRLWRHAVRHELEPSLLPLAFTISRRLALGPEANPVFARMAAEAVPKGASGNGTPIVTLSMDELREFLLGRQEEVARLQELYESGTCPVHLVARQLGWSLARLFHEAPLNREGSRGRGLTLASHGGRHALPSFPPDPRGWRLHIDLTALLLGEHLEILDSVERCFRPLRISSHMVPALLAMRSELLDDDEEAIGAAREVVALVDAGRIEPVAFGDQASVYASVPAVLERCAMLGASAVTWHNAAAEGETPFGWSASLSGVVAALVKAGALSPSREADARVRLGAAGAEPSAGCEPDLGAPLFFFANTVEILATAGVLDVLCATTTVYVDAGAIAELRRKLADWEARAATASWVDGIVRRLNSGIQDRTYELLPISVPEDDELGSRDLALASLMDLIRLPPAEWNAVWIDDRALTAYSACGPAALVNVADVMMSLRHYDRLSNEQLLRCVLRLRSGGVAFVPPFAGEVAFWLRRAPTAEGRVLETHELATLRRYVARCLLNERVLQVPPQPANAPNPKGEIDFVVSWQAATGEVLRELWGDSSIGGDQLLACSRWLIENLFVQRFERFPALQATPEGRLVLLLSSLSGLLCNGFLLLGRGDHDDERFRRYMRWLETELIAPRILVDPSLVTKLSEMLVQFLAASPREHTEDTLLVRRHLTARFVDGLPDRLKALVSGHPDVESALESPMQKRIVQVGPLAFHARPYLVAVVDALAGEVMELRDENGDLCRIEAKWENSQLVVLISSPRASLTISDPADAFLADDEVARNSLSANASWLDVPASERRKHLDALLAVRDRADRTLAALDLRMETASAFYSSLRLRAADGQPIDFHELQPPSAGALLDYLRLSGDAIFGERFARAADELILEFGLEEAFGRLGALPVQLPLPIRDRLSAMPAAERADTFERWRTVYHSPVHRVNLAREATLSANDLSDNEQADRFAVWAVASAEDGSMDALAALLRAFGARSAEWPGIRDLTPGERIAVCWAHAGEVFRILGTAVDPGELGSLAERFVGESLPAAFADERVYRSDVSCPQHMSSEAISLWGVTFVSAAREGARCLPEEVNLVRKLAAHEVSGAPFPSGLLLEPKFVRPDALGSFLAASLATVLNSAGLGDIAGWSSRDNQDALLRHGLETAGGDAEKLNAWHLVLALAGLCDLPDEYGDPLHAALERSTGLFAGVDEAFAGSMLRFIARQGIGPRAVGLRPILLARFSDAIEHRSALGDVDKGLRQLLRASIDLSRDEDGRFQPEAFAETCARLGRLGDEDGAVVRRFVSQAVRQLPFSDAERLWPLLVSLRAL